MDFFSEDSELSEHPLGRWAKQQPFNAEKSYLEQFSWPNHKHSLQHQRFSLLWKPMHLLQPQPTTDTIVIYSPCSRHTKGSPQSTEGQKREFAPLSCGVESLLTDLASLGTDWLREGGQGQGIWTQCGRMQTHHVPPTNWVSSGCHVHPKKKNTGN